MDILFQELHLAKCHQPRPPRRGIPESWWRVSPVGATATCMTSSNSPLATFSFPLLHLTASVLSFLKLHTDAFRDSYARKSFAEISCIRIGLLSNFLLLFIIICFFVLLLDIADLKKKSSSQGTTPGNIPERSVGFTILSNSKQACDNMTRHIKETSPIKIYIWGRGPGVHAQVAGGQLL